MLTLEIEGDDGYYDDDLEQFVPVKAAVVNLEHSLISISKWEAQWHVPFLGDDAKTDEQILSYVSHMVVGKSPPPEQLRIMAKANIAKIRDYIQNPMTATKFYDSPGNRVSATNAGKKQIITSEIMYWWMVAYQIPFECEKWHVNRLIALVRVCQIKNDSNSDKKMRGRELAAHNRALNEARRKRAGTTG